jgi:Hint domain
MVKSYIWNGGSGNYADQNWTDGLGDSGPPTASDDALINTGDTVTADSNDAALNLTIDNGTLYVATASGVLTVVDTLTVGESATGLDPNNVNSTLTVETGGTVSTASLVVGDQTGSDGEVNLDAAAASGNTLAADTVDIGVSGTGYLFLYTGASAQIDYSAGSANTTGTSEVGENAQSFGQILVSGSTFDVGGTLNLGDGGNGALIYNDALAQLGNVNLAVQSGSTGQLADEFSFVAVSGNLNAGVGGVGTVQVSLGGVLAVEGDLEIGDGDATAGSSVTVDPYLGVALPYATDQTAGLSVNGQIAVGFNGQGTLAIRNGGSVSANQTGQEDNQTAPLLVDSNPSLSDSEGLVTIDGVDPNNPNDPSTLNAGGPLVVGSLGTGEIDVTNGGLLLASTLDPDGNLAGGVSGLGQFQGSQGTIKVDGAGSTFNVDVLKVGAGDPNGDTPTGGTGILDISNGGTTNISQELDIAYSSGTTGTVDVSGPGSLLNLENVGYVGGNAGGAGGNAALTLDGSIETVDDAAPVVEIGSMLVLNSGGTLNLNNGIIEGGVLDFNGGNFLVGDTQLDYQHSVLQDVTIEGSDLNLAYGVLTLAGTTSGATGDNVLIDATGSLVDLSDLGGADDGESNLSQTINATDLALTIADPLFVIQPSDQAAAAVSSALATPSLGEIRGTGAIFSDYTQPVTGGFFSGNVDLQNSGLIDAVYNDEALDNSAQLSILTNVITNEPDGTFEADSGATLNVGDDTHVFTNLQNDGNGTSSLVDGFYDANGGDIDINGTVNPISTLEAVLYLTGVNGVAGDLSVNDTSIVQTLTTITPSGNGEGDLAINSATVTFSNPIEIQGLQSGEPTSWSFNTGYSGGGGGLYLDNGTFSGPGLTINAATTGGEAAFIFGNGVIDAPVTMNGTATVYDYDDGESINSLEFADAVTGSGIYTINGGDVLTFNSTLGVASDPITENTINFAGANSSLQVGAADVTDDFRATITDFAKGDTITLLNVEATSAQFDSVSDQLDVFNGNAEVATLQLDNTIPADQLFNVIPHGVDGSTIEFAPACFCGGTLIRTEYGEVAVETLAIGDRVMTASGELRRVEWIGRRKIAARFVDPLTVWPVRITAGALAEGMPSRDLLVSPDHAILVDDVLIQAGALVNGNSIIHETRVAETFIYYHIELADHSLIFAENTPAETFVDNIDRLGFDNWAEHEALFPNGNAIGEMPYPRAKAHRQVPRSISSRL